MGKSFHTAFDQATRINECYENDPTPAGLVDRGLRTSGGCRSRIKHKSPESFRGSSMIASRLGSSNALGDHVPPLPCGLAVFLRLRSVCWRRLTDRMDCFARSWQRLVWQPIWLSSSQPVARDVPV